MIRISISFWRRGYCIIFWRFYKLFYFFFARALIRSLSLSTEFILYKKKSKKKKKLRKWKQKNVKWCNSHKNVDYFSFFGFTSEFECLLEENTIIDGRQRKKPQPTTYSSNSNSSSSSNETWAQRPKYLNIPLDSLHCF